MKSFAQDGRVMIIVEKGELLVETLTREIVRLGVRGGLVTGLGALTKAELGFYHLTRKDYARRIFHDEYELISLTGNITLKGGAPYVHVHAVLGDSGFSTFGGHLFEAEVAVTVEVSVVPFPFAPTRELDAALGLSVICHI